MEHTISKDKMLKIHMFFQKVEGSLFTKVNDLYYSMLST